MAAGTTTKQVQGKGRPTHQLQDEEGPHGAFKNYTDDDKAATSKRTPHTYAARIVGTTTKQRQGKGAPHISCKTGDDYTQLYEEEKGNTHRPEEEREAKGND